MNEGESTGAELRYWLWAFSNMETYELSGSCKFIWLKNLDCSFFY